MSPVPANGKIILVSGINGFIAAHVGLQVLEAGYSLRGTSRSAHSAEPLLKGAYKDYADRVELFSVPDMTVDGAFDEAVKGTHPPSSPSYISLGPNPLLTSFPFQA